MPFPIPTLSKNETATWEGKRGGEEEEKRQNCQTFLLQQRRCGGGRGKAPSYNTNPLSLLKKKIGECVKRSGKSLAVFLSFYLSSSSYVFSCQYLEHSVHDVLSHVVRRLPVLAGDDRRGQVHLALGQVAHGGGEQAEAGVQQVGGVVAAGVAAGLRMRQPEPEDARAGGGDVAQVQRQEVQVGQHKGRVAGHDAGLQRLCRKKGYWNTPLALHTYIHMVHTYIGTYVHTYIHR